MKSAYIIAAVGAFVASVQAQCECDPTDSACFNECGTLLYVKAIKNLFLLINSVYQLAIPIIVFLNAVVTNVIRIVFLITGQEPTPIQNLIDGNNLHQPGKWNTHLLGLHLHLHG